MTREEVRRLAEKMISAQNSGLDKAVINALSRLSPENNFAVQSKMFEIRKGTGDGSSQNL